ncbi:MAG: hypothetical protein LV481_08910 [Methylacidiphilales bacterium]|nr:hypothetical protein [Candidatus Methylacidiphilales bacterium]
MAEVSKPTDPLSRGFPWKHYCLWGLPILFAFLVIFGPSAGSHWSSAMVSSSHAARQARAISLLMFAYANAHQGAYPTGTSSTEIFQKLIDENHMTSSGKSYHEIIEDLIDNKEVRDPAIFWLDIPGKIMATSTVLKPENVCWDVTVPVDKNSPGELPVVFVTGYKVTYASRGTAIPLPKTGDRKWTAIFYESGLCIGTSIEFGSPNEPSIQPDGTIINFIAANFDPAGKEYQQLTPDGPLAR